MGRAIGRDADQVRVLSDLSGSVVGALLDDEETRGPDDAFSTALRRYREEGAPELGGAWRRTAPLGAGGDREAEILRHLTRDLLEGVSTSRSEAVEAEPSAPAAEAPPPNVRQITDAREIPALELASDGTWKPSGSSVSSQDELDAGARRRANVPALVSRYPTLRRDRSGGFVLPPAPPPPLK